jgi:hypothetical protein
LGRKALERTLPFNESETLQCNLDTIRRELGTLKISSIELYVKEDKNALEKLSEDDLKKAEAAIPGQPTYRIM